MQIQLIEGSFSTEEALDIVTQMLQVKIMFHEKKIEKSDQEEDIKLRERKIKRLQDDLSEVKKAILSKGNNCHLKSEIEIN